MPYSPSPCSSPRDAAKHHTHVAVSMAPWPILHPAHNTIARGTTHRARALRSGAVNGISAWQIMASLIWPRFAVGSLTSTQCCREGWIQHHAACPPSPLHPRHDDVICSHLLRLHQHQHRCGRCMTTEPLPPDAAHVAQCICLQTK